MKNKVIKLLVLPCVENMQCVVKKFPFEVKLIKGSLGNIKIIFSDQQVKVLHSGVDLEEFSFVWLCSSWATRDIAYAIQLYLKEKRIPHTTVEKGTSKLTDQMRFSLDGKKCPKSLFLGTKKIKDNIEQIEKTCGFPLIVKDLKGSQGRNSIKVSSANQLLREVKKLPVHKKYIFQQFIENDYDWGVMVVDGKVVSGEKSYPRRGEFRNNTCNGATEVFVGISAIPAQVKRMAIDASQSLGLNWSRADVLIDKKTKEPYLLEVNRLPGISARTSEVEGAYKFISNQLKVKLSSREEGIN